MIKTNTNKSQVYLRFQLTQHISPPPPPARGEGRGPAGPNRGPPAGDEELIKSLIEYLGCGTVHKDRNTFNFLVSKFSDIDHKIIPFFSKYPIHGVKFLDYLD